MPPAPYGGTVGLRGQMHPGAGGQPFQAFAHSHPPHLLQQPHQGPVQDMNLQSQMAQLHGSNPMAHAVPPPTDQPPQPKIVYAVRDPNVLPSSPPAPQSRQQTAEGGHPVPAVASSSGDYFDRGAQPFDSQNSPPRSGLNTRDQRTNHEGSALSQQQQNQGGASSGIPPACSPAYWTPQDPYNPQNALFNDSNNPSAARQQTPIQSSQYSRAPDFFQSSSAPHKPRQESGSRPAQPNLQQPQRSMLPDTHANLVHSFDFDRGRTAQSMRGTTTKGVNPLAQVGCRRFPKPSGNGPVGLTPFPVPHRPFTTRLPPEQQHNPYADPIQHHVSVSEQQPSGPPDFGGAGTETEMRTIGEGGQGSIFRVDLVSSSCPTERSDSADLQKRGRTLDSADTPVSSLSQLRERTAEPPHGGEEMQPRVPAAAVAVAGGLEGEACSSSPNPLPVGRPEGSAAVVESGRRMRPPAPGGADGGGVQQSGGVNFGSFSAHHSVADGLEEKAGGGDRVKVTDQQEVPHVRDTREVGGGDLRVPTAPPDSSPLSTEIADTCRVDLFFPSPDEQPLPSESSWSRMRGLSGGGQVLGGYKGGGRGRDRFPSAGSLPTVPEGELPSALSSEPFSASGVIRSNRVSSGRSASGYTDPPFHRAPLPMGSSAPSASSSSSFSFSRHQTSQLPALQEEDSTQTGTNSADPPSQLDAFLDPNGRVTERGPTEDPSNRGGRSRPEVAVRAKEKEKGDPWGSPPVSSAEDRRSNAVRNGRDTEGVGGEGSNSTEAHRTQAKPNSSLLRGAEISGVFGAGKEKGEGTGKDETEEEDDGLVDPFLCG
mmetsp:Transcript_49798/g.98142  ORF Transcript_49798/g.98142 Transcript_49798/m.98142 type:complete len:821 (-) Transcript_49798:564-3026(-)